MILRVGLGYDVHAFTADRPLVLGGVVLPGPGLAGHSDADVAAHVVADALLGAAGFDDLGTLFPASDERWRGVASLDLLREVAALLREAGWRVVNVDVVLNVEQPRLAPHVAEMRRNLSGALDAARATDDVPITVKPKRGEGIGLVGRSEGIQGWAVALLQRADEPVPAAESGP